MTTLTIPKKLIQKGDLVIISCKEYENLLRAVEKNHLKIGCIKSRIYQNYGKE